MPKASHSEVNLKTGLQNENVFKMGELNTFTHIHARLMAVFFS